MKTKVIKIGNSKGIRIPKTLLEECGFKDHLTLRIYGNSLILTPLGKKDSVQEQMKNTDDFLSAFRDWASPEEDEAWKHLQK